MHIIVGLGNPGDEYTDTRHNAGMIVLDAFIKKTGGEWKMEKAANAVTAKGESDGEKVLLVKPQTFMNRSGSSLKYFIDSPKKTEKLIVVHDDLDLPLGAMRIVYNRGSGGHKGVESIVRAIKTEKFTRIRIGVAPKTPGGKTKKVGSEKVPDFIVGEFKKAEMDEVKKIAKKGAEALSAIVNEGREKAMNEFN